MSTSNEKGCKLARQIVIIGSGVIGLTAAYELSKSYKADEVAITIVARDMPHDGLDSTGWASPWAGASWCPFQNKDPENRWQRVSYQKYKTEVPKEFIMFKDVKYYSTGEAEVVLKDIWYDEVVGGYKPLPKPYPGSIDVSSSVVSGFQFTTLSICVPAYLVWLQDELAKRGVKFVKGWVGNISDVEYVPGSDGQVKTDVVINASGLGAKTIVGIADPLVHPIRGQTVLVRAPRVNWCFLDMSSAETTYMLPRINGDVILGGTFQVGNWDVSPDPDVARGILERSLVHCPELVAPANETTATKPSISDIKVLRHNVGLRPARTGGARVEKEIVAFPGRSDTASWNAIAPIPSGLVAGQSVPDVDSRDAGANAVAGNATIKVVHAYGVGASGYQECWGIAEDVTKLVAEFFMSMD